MRVLHRTAAALLGIGATVLVVWLIKAVASGDDIKVLNFVLYVFAAALALALAQFLWRDPS